MCKFLQPVRFRQFMFLLDAQLDYARQQIKTFFNFFKHTLLIKPCSGYAKLSYTDC